MDRSPIRFFSSIESYGFLSNFAPLAVTLRTPRFGVECATSEHLYQALKYDYADAPEANRKLVELIGAQRTPFKAKIVGNALCRNVRYSAPWQIELTRLARAVTNDDVVMAPNDDAARIDRMRVVLRVKFTADVDKRRDLLATTPRALCEASPFDRFWGELGANHLGRLLVELRDALADEYADESDQLSSLVDDARYAAIGKDAQRVRRIVAALGTRNDFVDRCGLHFYPRSMSYEVDGHGRGTDVFLYGGDVRGRTVACRVTGYEPYMFVRAHDASDAAIERFVSRLECALVIVAAQSRNGTIGAQVRRAMLECEAPLLRRYTIVDGVSMKSCGNDRGFNNSRVERFIQLWWYAPSLVKAVRNLVEFAYDHRADRFATVKELAAAFVDGVCNAREREQRAQPDTDVKGHVRSAKKRTAAQRDMDAECEQTRSSLSIFASERRAAHNLAQLRHANVTCNEALNVAAADDEECEMHDNPWSDMNVDLAYDDIDCAPTDANDALRLDFACVQHALNAFDAHDLTLGDTLLECGREVEIYEADIDFVVRFCIDAGFKPEECVRVRQGADIVEGLYSSHARCLNDIEFSCHYSALERVDDDDVQTCVPPQVCLSFDCEMELGPDNRFPKPESERVLQACCVVFDPVADPHCEHVVRRAFVVGRVDLTGFDAEEVYSFAGDRELAQAFAEFVRALQPDMITGWNIENFDLWYLFERAATDGASHNNVARICRRPGACARVRERQFQSSAHGTHVYKEVSGEGLWVWDLFQVIKRSTSFKFRSYSLEYVSNKILGDRKEDVSYSAINRLQSTPVGRARLMSYCAKDALLPARLVGRLTLLVENIEMSRMNGVPIDMIARRGLQIRLKAFMYRKGRYTSPARHLFYTRTSNDRIASLSGESYAGAHVESPIIGLHDEVVVTLDFKSLYPSIMVTFGMCLKTLVPGVQLAERCAQHALDVECDVWKPTTCALPGTLDEQPAFVRSSHTRGLVTDILIEMLAERKRVKALMCCAKDANDSAMVAIYDKRQLAIKLNCNSTYGAFGARSSFAYCPEIAAMVTAYGRQIILETKAIVERLFTRANGFPFDASVVYGDSVVGNTAVVIRRHEHSSVEIVRCDNLFDEFAEWSVDERGKKIVYDRSVGGAIDLPFVRDEHGFTQMRRLIRHRCDKEIVRVLTHTGIVDCTTDHSLIAYDGSDVRPNDVRVGSRLLHATAMNESVFVKAGDEIHDLDEAFIMGLFLADGTAGQCGEHSAWMIRKTNRRLLEVASERCSFPTLIYDTLEPSNVYSLSARGNVTQLASRYCALFYNARREKQVPRQIINADVAVIREFLQGFYYGDGDAIERFDQRGKQVSQGVWMLANRLGWSTSLNDRNDKPNVFRVTLSHHTEDDDNCKRQRIDPVAVKKDLRVCENAGTRTMVYDIETDSHHFHVGPGDLVVHNTDSVFVKLHVPAGASDSTNKPLERVSTEDSAVWGELMARFVSLYFARKFGLRDDNIIELEFEKTFSKIIFYAKKRYVGWKWVLTAIEKLRALSKRAVCDAARVLDDAFECVMRAKVESDESEQIIDSASYTRRKLAAKAMQQLPEPDASGMETERRDSCLLVSDGVKHVVRLLLDGDDTMTRAKALERVREHIVDEMVAPIESNTVPWHRLIQSKQFRMRIGEYTARGQTAPIHIQLAAKLDRRLGANAPGTHQPGDRVPYVVVEALEPGGKTSECGETPDYAWTQRVRLSRAHYIDKQVHGTMQRILEPVLLGAYADGSRTLISLSSVPSTSTVAASVPTNKSARKLEAKRAYTSFVQQRAPKRQRLVGVSVPTHSLAAVAKRRIVRCRVCGALGNEPQCSTHTTDDLTRFADETRQKRQRIDNDRQSLWRTCTACTQGWRAEDDVQRAATLPPLDVEDTIEQLIACKNATCEIYWQRRLNDRMSDAK